MEGKKNMAYGKAIELFLVNGTADSLVTAELSNWNGKAIKIPRTEVHDCDREDMKGAGVYFLFCQEEDGDASVYIGEAENVLDRLVEIARDSKSYVVLTKNTYKNTVMKESQVAVMEEFIENVKILISTLGYKVLLPAPQATDDTIYLYCKGSGASAKGFVSAGGFTVLKDSIVSDHIVPSLETRGKTYYNLRNKLEVDGVISERKFVRNYEFSAPSAASAVILGHTSNGNMDWKTAGGVRLKDL